MAVFIWQTLFYWKTWKTRKLTSLTHALANLNLKVQQISVTVSKCVKTCQPSVQTGLNVSKLSKLVKTVIISYTTVGNTFRRLLTIDNPVRWPLAALPKPDCQKCAVISKTGHNQVTRFTVTPIVTVRCLKMSLFDDFHEKHEINSFDILDWWD